MARRTFEGTPLLPGMTEADRPYTPQNPPKPRSGSTAKNPRRIHWLHFSLRFAAWAIAILAILWGFTRVEAFLIGDPRFVLAAATEEQPGLVIRGAVYASRAQLERVFADDIGRSVYLSPLALRRQMLMQADWVKDASVSRQWPNRIVVSVTERKPVAFAPIGPSRISLIDEDGVLLPPAKDRFRLPVLAGIKAADTLEIRKERVRRMLQLLRELGDLAGRLSEIDVSDRDNLKVTESTGAGVITLVMGDRNFAARMQNYLEHYADIQKRLPGAKTLDLRLEDRITVIEGRPHGS